MTETSLQRRFVTPEGVDLRLQLGAASQRVTAFMLDLAFMLGTLILFTIAVALIAWGTGWNGIGLIVALWLLGFFLLRNAWFILFEMGGRAATPGKRILGLRVVARNGGRLTGDAVIARNAMREIEFFLPLSFLGIRAAEGMAGAWTAIFGLAWSGIFLFFPLLNRDRLRVGDLLAGTWVISTPKRRLGLDLGQAPQRTAYDFSKAQLDAYGIYELQKLEEVLRRRDWQQMYAVATSIRNRIGWRHGPDDAEFLAAYYAALRDHLERGLLFGVRRADKHDEGRGRQG
ncbi:hypothetical protein CLG96_14640 [Sphingomonas oleivorans]|uniref:RDD domain-containing protein n=1 Tax=Sphingomonas oleivorans TaxID=1735121 RepID=A0A2T5FVF8_9SPHN|nr:RDD family protein [Sphingomonas oleivorans]PTQ09428.1 hypothetical protein CLG96_14640 [Sphingomonas oleivorans]